MIGVTLGDFLAGLNESSSDERVISGFAVDSRKVREGFVFFAIKGEKVDGHDFLYEAFEKGAIAAVVSSKQVRVPEGMKVIFTHDVLELMQSLARKVLAQVNKTVVAITGSMGKTTTKEYTCALLEKKYKVFKTPGNANSQIGLPLSILNEPSWDVDVLVLEMGMTAGGHISKLIEIAPPDIAVITKIAPAHIEYFSDGLEGIARAKAEILLSKNTKFAVIESEAKKYKAIGEALTMPYVTYGMQGYTLTEKDGHIFAQHEGQCLAELHLQDTPSHLRGNFLAAALVARYLGLSWSEIAKGSINLPSAEKRYEMIQKLGVTYISDCYNANPESMKAALLSLPRPKGDGRRIAALGPMVELGCKSDGYHAEVGSIAAEVVDVLFCLDPRCLAMKDGFEKGGKKAYYFADLAQMKASLSSFVRPDDVVLIKASNKIGLWNLLDDESKQFN